MSAQVGNFSETDCLQAITGSTLVTPHDLLLAWAATLGVATSWSMGNLDTLKAIALHYGAVSVGNWSETDCYRSIAAANGASSVGSLSALDCLKAIVNAPPLVSVPVNLTVPIITGNNWEGQTLSVTNGTWSGSPTGYSYQWTANGTSIGGATDSTLVLASGQAETVVRCVVTAINSAGSTGTTSSPTSNIIGAPTTIFSTSLTGWYDPSDAASITQSIGLVSQWNDKSGNGNHLTGSGTGRPTYGATVIQGKPGLTLDGVNNLMSVSGVAPGSTSAMSLFTMSEADATMTQQDRLLTYTGNGEGNDNTSGSAGFLIAESVYGTIGARRSTTWLGAWHTVYASGAQPPMGKQLVRMGSVFDGTNHTFYLDNSPSTPLASTGAFASPGVLRLGVFSDDSSFKWTGNVGEIILVKRAATSTDRDKLQRWFVRNWSRVLVTEGDSTVHGAVGTSPPIEAGYPRLFSYNASPSCFVDNIAIGGSSLNSDGTTATCTTRAANGYANRIPSTGKDGKKYIFYAYISNNIGGPTNNAADYAVAWISYMSDRRAEGYDYCVTATILDRTDAQQNETVRHAFNTIIRDPTWVGLKANGGPIDAVVDLAGDSIMGVDNAPTVNPTYFQDQVHPNSAGYARLEAIFTPVINSLP